MQPRTDPLQTHMCMCRPRCNTLPDLLERLSWAFRACLCQQAGGWDWHAPREAALERDGTCNGKYESSRGDPAEAAKADMVPASLLDTLSGAGGSNESTARQLLLASVADAGTKAWAEYDDAKQKQQRWLQKRARHGQELGSATGGLVVGRESSSARPKPPVQLSSEERQALSERLHGEGDELKERKRWLVEQYKRHNPNKLAVGTSRLSEEERRRAAERMYAAAEEHRKRRERADELYLMNIMKRTEAQVKALKGAPSAWATPRPGGGAAQGAAVTNGEGHGRSGPPTSSAAARGGRAGSSNAVGGGGAALKHRPPPAMPSASPAEGG